MYELAKFKHFNTNNKKHKQILVKTQQKKIIPAHFRPEIVFWNQNEPAGKKEFLGQFIPCLIKLRKVACAVINLPTSDQPAEAE